MRKFVLTVSIVWIVAGLGVSFSAQTKGRKSNARPGATQTPENKSAATQPTEPEPARTPRTKKNERPNGNPSDEQNSLKAKFEPNYFYEFSQPDFTVSKIRIEHDEAGKGFITFVKNVSAEEITDPIEVAPAALERINAALAALDFLNSQESYQFEKDYSHLGNVTLKIRKGQRERETKFNWTQNAEARKLADEYRKLGNQYIWIFDIKLSRENQPLNAPQLMDLLDNFVKRNEISDPAQMLPLLRELGNDERIPLIARNHAARLAANIEKEIKKSEK